MNLEDCDKLKQMLKDGITQLSGEQEFQMYEIVDEWRREHDAIQKR